jgi:hypothetical protein
MKLQYGLHRRLEEVLVLRCNRIDKFAFSLLKDLPATTEELSAF